MHDHFITIPLAQCRRDGSIQPNPIFHRPWNKLHSRCIEYPFAASHLDPHAVILDLGSDKADDIWLKFLNSLPGKAYFFDYEQTRPSDFKITLGDCRSLPFDDDTFDIICAVSLIEHIGLNKSQVSGEKQPQASKDGDLETLEECCRVLKPEGKIIMTVPMGVRSGYFSGGSARVYVKDDIMRFSKVLKPVILDYYEYRLQNGKNSLPICKANNFGSNGLATWQKVSLDKAQANNDITIDGVLLSVWTK